MDKCYESFKPGWIGNIDSKLYDDNFLKIIVFFVIECSCGKTSSRGINIKKIWGNDVWKKQKLRNRLLDNGEFYIKENYIKVKKLSEISNGLAFAKINGNFNRKYKKNTIVFYSDGTPEIEVILFYIRCAFAHGRFMIKIKKNVKFYILEAGKYNSNKQKVELRSRIIIKEQTLLDWINIIEKGDVN